MKQFILILLFSLSTLFGIAQDKPVTDTLRVDLDKDSKKDIVIFDRDNAVLIVKLSTQNFKTVKTKVLEFDPIVARIEVTKSGFEYRNNWMRAGYACQFRYNPTQKQVQLIGMSRFELGPASNDGSGESSVNLSTNSYIGNWHYWDESKRKLITMPSIKQKMILPKLYFADFSDEIISEYTERCSAIYQKEKDRLLAKR